MIYAITKPDEIDAAGLKLRRDGYQVRDVIRVLGGSLAVLIARKEGSDSFLREYLRNGSGCMGIDAARLDTHAQPRPATGRPKFDGVYRQGLVDEEGYDGSKGRFPANVMVMPDAAQVLDGQSGDVGGGGRRRMASEGTIWGSCGYFETVAGYDDEGGASRFFHEVEGNRALEGVLQLLLDATDTSSP